MDILVDQNISFRLVQRVAEVFPGIRHVKSLGLTDASDLRIFMAARELGFVGVFTQDEDFYNLLLEHGTPPKVVWLRTGNCSTAYLADVVLHNALLIQTFLEDDSQDCLEIYG